MNGVLSARNQLETTFESISAGWTANARRPQPWSHPQSAAPKWVAMADSRAVIPAVQMTAKRGKRRFVRATTIGRRVRRRGNTVRESSSDRRQFRRPTRRTQRSNGRSMEVRKCDVNAVVGRRLQPRSGAFELRPKVRFRMWIGPVLDSSNFSLGTLKEMSGSGSEVFSACPWTASNSDSDSIRVRARISQGGTVNEKNIRPFDGTCRRPEQRMILQVAY